jgi:hypothetical protein
MRRRQIGLAIVCLLLGASTACEVEKGACRVQGIHCADDFSLGECQSLNGSWSGGVTCSGDALSTRPLTDPSR